MAFTYRNSHSGTTVSFDEAQPDLVAAGHWTLIADDLDADAEAAVADLDALRDPAAAQAALVESARVTRESGHDGPVGPQGPAGEDGEDGEDGADSVVAGPQGPEGDPGADSVVAGPEGPAGDDGATGPEGPAGPEGPEGPAGPEGDAGAAGAAGATGATGATGPAGTQPFTRDEANTRTYATATGDGFVIGSDRFDRDGADTSKDKRAWFNKTKGAFRAGITIGTFWDNANVGTASAAFGEDTTASAYGSFAAGRGYNSSASGIDSAVFGYGCTASGSQAFATGQQSLASGDASTAEGTHANASRHAQYAKSAGGFSAVLGDGSAQISNFVARTITTTATPALVTFDETAVDLTGSDVNVLTITVSRAHRIRIEAIARRTDAAGEHAAWTITCTMVRDSTGNARFIASPVVVTESEGAASAWTLVATVDTSNGTNNYLKLTATGEASKTIRWVAGIYTTEVG